jgi:transposase
LSAHAISSPIIARKKLVGQGVTLENQIRSLAVVFGVRLPRASPAAGNPGVGQLIALAFVAPVDDPSRIRQSRDVGRLVPNRYQSGDVDYVGGISKCGDRRVRTLPYEAANVMVTR